MVVNSSTSSFYKLSTTDHAQNTPIAQTVIAIAEHFMVKIDPEIAQRLGIQDGDIVSQIEDGTGTIKLIFTNTRKMVTGNHHGAINQDYGR